MPETLESCRDKRLKKRRENYQKNRAHILEKNAEWVKKNPASSSAATKKYRKKNRAACNARTYAYSKANPKRRLATKRKYWAAHPEKLRAQNQRRRARKLGASVGDEAVIAKWEASWRKKRRVRCYWCRQVFTPKGCHTDHIIPLEKTGPHSIENLCISCAPCNLSKQAKSLDLWNSQIEAPSLF